MQLAAVVLAAGKGTRMKSQLTKVLHPICGQPMVEYVLEAVRSAGVTKTVLVVGYGAEQVVAQIGEKAEYAYQTEQLGTAHALLQTREALADFTGDILVVCGDTPLIRAQTIAQLLQVHREKGYGATVLTAKASDPTDYGRIIRNDRGDLQRIVEQKDASPEEQAVTEVNTGIYCFQSRGLFAALAAFNADNAQGEYYLTDIVAHYTGQGIATGAVIVEDFNEVTGINNRCQLADAAKIMGRRLLEEQMHAGVTVLDPDSTFIAPGVQIGQDTIIYPFTIIEGKTKIGENCIIGPSSRLVDAQLGSGITAANSVIYESTLGDGCIIGPFAYLRPGCTLEAGVKVGDFVEVKNSHLGAGCKVPHLSYVGDALVGAKANIGAGTITCNYDGQKKSMTRIGDHAFIGSNTNLVAPVEVGSGAITGAGSTITKDVPENALGVARGMQKNYIDWAEKKRRSGLQAE